MVFDATALENIASGNEWLRTRSRYRVDVRVLVAQEFDLGC